MKRIRKASPLVLTSGVLLLLASATVGACDSSSPSPRTPEHPATSSRALTGPPSISAFVLYAERSAKLGARDSVHGGDVGVHAQAPPGTNAQLRIGRFGRVEGDETLVSPSVLLEEHASVGDVETDALQNHGAQLGAVSGFPSSTPPVPLALTAAPGVQDVTVHRMEHETLTAGAYGAVRVVGALWLEPGTYSFSSMSLEDGGRVLAKHGGVDVRIQGRLTAGHHGVMIPERDDDPASQLVVSVSGGDASDRSAAAAIGPDSVIRCLLAAPHGTVSLGDGALAVGAFAGFDVELGDDARVVWQSGFAANGAGQQGQQPVVIGYGSPPFSTAPVVGPVPASTMLNLAIGLPVADLPGLRAMVQEVSDRASPQYRQYLTPTQFTAQFGPSASDYSALSGWATGAGFSIGATSPNNMVLAVSASAATAEQALHLNMNYYLRGDGTPFVAPDRDPTLDLTVSVLSIEGLDTYRPWTTGLFADDYRIAYATPRPSSPTTCEAPGQGGSQRVGIMTLDTFLPTDLANFAAQDPEFSSSAPNVVPVSADGISTAPPVFQCVCANTMCGSACVNTLVDPNNCGACGQRCGPGTPLCDPVTTPDGNTTGTCVSTCGSGLTNCNGSCLNLGGSTSCSCNSGGTMCGGACVDTSSDPANCGSCGNVCGSSQVCSNGACSTSCPFGFSRCGGACINLEGDPKNCGACGNACTSGLSCAPCYADAPARTLVGLGEITLDIQMVLSMAPRARVNVFEGHTLDAILAKMATATPLANQLTTSYSQGGQLCNDGTNQQLMDELAIQGQAFFTASGDYGAYPTNQDSWCPYLDGFTFVGGTNLKLSSTTPETWGSEGSWAVPSGDTTDNCNFKNCSGGGVINGAPLPDYQAALGAATWTANGGSSLHRNVPDVSMSGAGPSLFFWQNAAWVAAGTSVASPLWAGFTALVNDRAATASTPAPPVGYLNPALYALGRSGAMATSGQCQPNMYFNDICDEGNTRSAGDPAGYTAVGGFDLVTGWGSPKCELIDQLICPRLCSGACANLDSDPANCGVCGNVCPHGEVCILGRCQGPAVAITAGTTDACAVLVGGTAVCWGNSLLGQLGNGTGDGQDNVASPTPTRVIGLFSAAQIVSDTSGFVVDTDDTCALSTRVTAEPAVECWGNNAFHELGDLGTEPFSTTPVASSAFVSAQVADIAVGSAMCVVLTNGNVYCWGENDSGELGQGTTQPFSPTPVQVPLAGPAAMPAGAGLHSIVEGANYVCVILGTSASSQFGSVQCWGTNHVGEIGDGTTNDPTLSPTFVTGLTSAVALAAGFQHTCAIVGGLGTGAGGVECWGDNGVADLGEVTDTDPFVASPIVVGAPTGPLFNAIAISAGDFHTCVVLSGGAVWCWGANNLGQLGLGVTDVVAHWVGPAMLTGQATAVAAGGSHTCALMTDGTVQCWGENNLGQLGRGTTSIAEPVPQPVNF